MVLKIGDLDFSNDVTKVQIFSSIDNPYVTVGFEVFVDVNDILNFLTPDRTMKLTIVPLRELGSQGSTLSLDLLIIKMDYDFVIKPALYKTKQPDRVIVNIVTVVKDAFKVMTTMVNNIYFEKTVSEIAQDLVSDCKGTFSIDSDNLNTKPISQVLVPPTTLYRALMYLDYYYGFFKGIPSIQCHADKKVEIMNLSKRLDKNYLITIYQYIPNVNLQEIIDKSVDGKNFYTTSNIITADVTSSRFASTAKNILYVTKPSDSLYDTVQKDIETIAKSYALSYKNSNLKVDSPSLNRNRVVTDHVGFEDDDTFAISQTASSIGDLATLTITLDQNLSNISNLLSTGTAVKFDSQVPEYMGLTGKYIMKSSNILFTKKVDWRARCTMNIMRTNKQI